MLRKFVKLRNALHLQKVVSIIPCIMFSINNDSIQETVRSHKNTKMLKIFNYNIYLSLNENLKVIQIRHLS